MKNKKKKFITRKVGLLPETLVYIGDETSDKVEINCIDYNSDTLEERGISTIDNKIVLIPENKIRWIDVKGLNNPPKISSIANAFSIHLLVQEDILDTKQRPKMDRYENYVYVDFNLLSYSKDKHEISTEQVGIVLGENYVLTFREKDNELINSLDNRLKNNIGKIRKSSSKYFMYMAIDIAVDYYYSLIEDMIDEVEQLEETIINSHNGKLIIEIQKLKSHINYIYKTISPLKEIVNNLIRDEDEFIGEDLNPYFRDVYDHINQIIDSIDTLRDSANSLTELNYNQANTKLNDVMKVLTIISTIFMPLSFIVGFYGMNFKFMPELAEPWAYPVIIGIIVLVAVLMIIYFKKRKWW